MQLRELLPALHDLPRPDKFRALQFLTTDLAQEESGILANGAAYPVWSPFDAVDAGTALQAYLNKPQSNG